MSSVADLKDAADVRKFGGKAANLAKMLQVGLLVPGGLAVAVEAFDGGRLRAEAKQIVNVYLYQNPEKLFAVRSSALAEDAEGASWAGQFETFLNTKPTNVIEKIEDCHNSAKARTKAYAEEKGETKQFNVAVVVQEMIAPKYAGVMFTKNPSNGANQLVVEYVSGLGEALVHGDADPERVIWARSTRKIKEQTEKRLPVPLAELVRLAEKNEKAFAKIPQDIEWAYDGKKVWLVQTRPITTLQERGVGKHYLGDPGGLWYWGPSRATPLYMSDFIDAAAKFFAKTFSNDGQPEAPKTLVLFHGNQDVWLIKQAALDKFVTDLFKVYEKADRLKRDEAVWREAVIKLDEYVAQANTLDLKKLNQLFGEAWLATITAEFSLYGAETVLLERLARFDEKARHEIWGVMTLADQPTFMQRLDVELAETGDATGLAKKYPWIEDGYGGVLGEAETYFKKRLKIVKDNVVTETSSPEKRAGIIEKHGLKPSEVSALDLARELAVFMDERKAWMMRSRSYIKRAAEVAAKKLGLTIAGIENSTLASLADGKAETYYGGSFMAGKHILFNEDDVNLAWDWYVEFRASKAVLEGLVASSGGRHFINGEIFVGYSPTDAMPDGAVLVVPSTSPSYVPLMRSARALITDHGGMMSHAAIVAREFGLPCIVGTKRATKILKDGDKVVLDLVKGIVNR